MAFDPDAYLAQKTDGGFDPDAYLASKGGGAKSSLLPSGTPSKPREYTDAQLGLDGGAIKSSYGAGGFAGSTLGRAGANLRNDFKQTDIVPANPVPTGKAPPGPMPDRLERDAGPMADDWLAQGIAGTLASAGAGEMVGPLLSRAGKLSPLIKKAAEKAAPVIRGAVEGGVGTKAQGGDAKGGAGMGAGLAMLGPLGRGLTKTRGAQARQFIEQHGGEVGLTTPGEGKPFDEMVTRGTTDADIGRQSVDSAEKGLGMLNEKDAARKRPIGEQMSAIDRSPAGEEPRVIDPIYSALDEEVNRIGAPPRTESTLGWALDEMDRGNAGRYKGQRAVTEPIPMRVRSTDDPTAMLNKLIDQGVSPAEAMRQLKANEALADEALRAGKPVPRKTVQGEIPADPRTLKESELNRIRRGVSERGQVGTSVSGAHAGERDAAAMLRSAVDEGPYAGVNKDYSKASYTNQKDRRLLGITERRRGPAESRASVERVANVIGRRGQRTITAGKDIDRLAQFERRNPEIGMELAKPAMLRAKGDLSFGLLPQKHGGLIDRTSGAVHLGGLATAAASLAGHGGTHGLLAALATLGAGLTMRNLPAIEGRALAPLGEALAGGGASKLSPLLAAALAAEQRSSSKESR